MNEYLHVEKPFLDRLAGLGWRVIDQGQGVIPTEAAGSLRTRRSPPSLHRGGSASSGTRRSGGNGTLRESSESTRTKKVSCVLAGPIACFGKTAQDWTCSGTATRTPHEALVQQLALQEKRDGSLAEAGAHLGKVDGGEVDESTVTNEASFQEQSMPVGVPPNELSSALEHNESGATDGLSGCFRSEVLYQPEDEAPDPSVKPLVVTKGYTEHLGKCRGSGPTNG